jgi:hypothetical protein
VQSVVMVATAGLYSLPWQGPRMIPAYAVVLSLQHSAQGQSLHVAQWAGYWALTVYLNNVLPNEVRGYCVDVVCGGGRGCIVVQCTCGGRWCCCVHLALAKYLPSRNLCCGAEHPAYSAGPSAERFGDCNRCYSS